MSSSRLYRYVATGKRILTAMSALEINICKLYSINCEVCENKGHQVLK